MESAAGLGLIGYLSASMAYFAVSVQLGWAGGRRVPSIVLMAACIATAFWAASEAYFIAYGEGILVSPIFIEVVHRILWTISLLFFLRLGKPETGGLNFYILISCLVFIVICFIAEILGFSQFGLPVVYRILLFIIGLVLLENVYRNLGPDGRWGVKFFAIGLGGVLIFDIFYYANATLVGEIEQSFYEARGWAYAVAAPLVGVTAYRTKYWSTDISISRQVAFYSSTVALVGLFIVAMSASAYLIRQLGGAWGPAVQVTFLFSAFLVLAVLLTSGTYRAHTKVFINKHFFRYRYDYREEWLKFTKAAADNGSRLNLEDRLLQAIADPLESPAAALWLRDGSSFAVEASWNMAATSFSCGAAEAMVDYMKDRDWVLVLDSDETSPDFDVPTAITGIQDGWILVPLLHLSDLIGFVLLSRPRAPRKLTWEDFDLLRTVGRQASGYLAERRVSAALAEARQFERFNRRSAFVLHDIKNLVSQLKLMADNLDRHGENPEFRNDMSLTVKNVVSKMQSMIGRLSERDEEEGPANATAVRLVPLLREVAEPTAEVRIEGEAARTLVNGLPERLTSLFGHLIDNAKEAAGDRGWVRVSVFDHPERLVVEVSDNGPGMDDRFVRDELFTPFRSTKPGGFGIGLYQCRDYAREMGGDLEVITSPGSGTTVRVWFPKALGRGVTSESAAATVS